MNAAEHRGSSRGDGTAETSSDHFMSFSILKIYITVIPYCSADSHKNIHKDLAKLRGTKSFKVFSVRQSVMPTW